MPEFADRFRIKARCLSISDNAILVRTEEGDQAWIPNSQVDDDSEVYKQGDEGELVVSQWIAEQKGWV